MGSVLLDNWGISACAAKFLSCVDPYYLDYFGGELDYPSHAQEVNLCWQNFLTSVVLWDEILISPSVDSRHGNLHLTPFCSYISRRCNADFVYTIPEFDLNQADVLDKYLNPDFAVNWLLAEPNEYIALIRGINYLIKANTLGHNYIPHPHRAILLERAMIEQEKFNRKIFLDTVDEDIRHYVDCVNKLCKQKVKSLELPLLYYFISAHAGSPREELQVALELRENPKVKQLRKSINIIEKDIERGNIQSVEASILEARNVCRSITSRIYTKPITFTASLAVSPSINFGVEAEKTVRSKLHTTFLFDLASFAISGKPSRKYRFVK